MGYIRKHLSAPALFESVRRSFSKAKFKSLRSSPYSWQDCLMSALAVFNLKFPSLLKFMDSQDKPFIRRNLRSLYGVTNVPSDTQLRERLDLLLPKQIRGPFKVIFGHLQRSKVLERYQVLNGYYALSVDGTGQYSSKSIHCKECCQKQHRNGETTYYHHLLAGAIVHPDEKVVIPVAPEPITKRDGVKKNDCERNAGKRFLVNFRQDHPRLKTLVVEDALAANHPHLSLLDSLSMAYIVGVKPGDHTFLFDWVARAKGEQFSQSDAKNTQHQFKITRDVPLNDTHYDYRVTVIEYCEEKANGKRQNFSWVTSLDITQENAYEAMRVARARWKIENETFNTLKNQGYNFEHNYGHGKWHLCSVMSMLMLLSFLIDQVQQAVCRHYQRARKSCGPLYDLQQKIRVLIDFVCWENWIDLYKCIADPIEHPPPVGRL